MSKDKDNQGPKDPKIIKGPWLDENQLTLLPDSIGNLTSITSLYLNDNQLRRTCKKRQNASSSETTERRKSAT